MNDDLDDLKAMMNDATPRPDAARRAENLALAQKNFDDLQGSREAARPTPANGPNGLWTGVKIMLNTFTSKAALTTTTALVACGFLFLTPQGQDLLSPPSGPELTRTEFDGEFAEPNVEDGPLREGDVTSDMLLREPLTEPVGEVIQSPPRILEEQPEAEVIPPIINEPLRNPVANLPNPQDMTTIRPEARERTVANMDELAAQSAKAAEEQTLDRSSGVLGAIAAQSADQHSQPQPAPTEAEPNNNSFSSFSSYDSGSILGNRQSAGLHNRDAEVIDQEIHDTLDEIFADEPVAPTTVVTDPNHWKSAGDMEADDFIVGSPDVSYAVNEQTASSNHTDIRAIPQPTTEAFPTEAPNDLKITSEDPVSTFSIDVDTAAYSVVRSSLMGGQLPPPQAVRIEEMINYFPYDYPAPDAGEAPFRPTVSAFPTPWNADTQLVHIALQGEMPALDDRPPLNLVFLIDTSGSMNQPNKLPLLKQSFRLMLDQLRPEDEVAIVAYAGSAGQVLAPTPASDRQTILQAIQSLQPGGGTNGQGGLQQAYAIADKMTAGGEVNRIVLATDGDFNVGISNPDALKDFIADKRQTGTYLSVLGFGRGNLDDATMQALAQNGNGTAAYIDTLNEAQKVLVDQLSGALFPIAGDVKVQVEFNPVQVAEYRLIGYETRALAREDFNNDKVDAGELGAGHAVTAIYEITPVGSPAQLSDPLRYAPNTVAATSDELGYVKLRYKEPGADVSQLIETPIVRGDSPGTEANFAAAIAGFGQLLRDDRYLGDWNYGDAIALANANRGTDPFGYRTEAVQLMRLAQSMSR